MDSRSTDSVLEENSDRLPSAPPTSILTHIALPVRDIDATVAFYRRYTTLEVIHERFDESTGLRTAWLANSADTTEAGAALGIRAARFVIVLICGALPKAIVGEMEEEYGFLTSISHLGLSCETREAVDLIASIAKREGCLLLGPMYRNVVVGYICIVTDPDGNNIEFSVEQVLG